MTSETKVAIGTVLALLGFLVVLPSVFFLVMVLTSRGQIQPEGFALLVVGPVVGALLVWAGRVVARRAG